MDSTRAANIFIICCLAIPTVVVLYKSIVAGRELKRCNQKAIDDAFTTVIGRHNMVNVRVLKNTVRLGGLARGKNKPFEVYRVLHSPPSRWFAYTHIQDSDPVLAPISEKRALAAVHS